MRLNKSMTHDEFEKKANELRNDQIALRIQLEHHQNRQDEFRATVGNLIRLMSEVSEIFMSSNIAQKRSLLTFVFSNLSLKGKKLEHTMRSPFQLMMNRSGYPSWLGRKDSNPRMAGPKPAALPLGDAPALGPEVIH